MIVAFFNLGVQPSSALDLMESYDISSLEKLLKELGKIKAIKDIENEAKKVNNYLIAIGTQTNEGIKSYKRWITQKKRELKELITEKTLFEKIRNSGENKTLFERLKGN